MLLVNIISTTLETIESTTQNINSRAIMSDQLKGVIVTVVVSALIQIIGFIVTYMSMRRSFKEELEKQKSNIALDKMTTMPYGILELQEDIFRTTKIETEIKNIKEQDNLSKDDLKKIENNEQKCKMIQDGLYDKMAYLLNTIYSYGSVDAIRIAAKMQNENYKANNDNNADIKFRIMAFYVLLATQVKFDVTGVITSPELWYQMRMSDYDLNKDTYIYANNQLVNELDLNKGFLV